MPDSFEPSAFETLFIGAESFRLGYVNTVAASVVTNRTTTITTASATVEDNVTVNIALTLAQTPELSNEDGETWYLVKDADWEAETHETYHLVQNLGATNIGIYQIAATMSVDDQQKWLDSPAATRHNQISVTVTAPEQNEHEIFAVLLDKNADNAADPTPSAISSQTFTITLADNGAGGVSFTFAAGTQTYLDGSVLKGKFAVRPGYETDSNVEEQALNYNGILSLGTPTSSHVA